MPTLNWIGKEAVAKHHLNVPFHLLKDVPSLSCGDPGTGNIILQADNLVGLKAILPYYAGQVKCITIDPPYNTGNEGWAYNDNVNSPAIKRWLGQVVGKEGETLDRHDRWLCMMYPRLVLLRQFLREDGVIFVCIDDNEVASLRFLMDEIFGAQNFIAVICWQKIFTVKNSAKHLSEMHDYVVIYARNKDVWLPNLAQRTSEADANYTNPDNDPRGVWASNALQSRNFYSKGTYSIKCPGGRVVEGPPSGTYWRMEEARLWQLDADNRVWWGNSRNNSPRIKKFLSEAKQGMVPTTWWTHEFAGTNSGAKTEARSIMGDLPTFMTPKPKELIERILQIATNPGDLVLDSFGGSGTTAHAVLKLNAVEAASRRLELEEKTQDASSTDLSRRLPDEEKTRDASSTNYFDPGEPVAHLSGNLPHWRQEGATYFVTFRTADSMPQEKLKLWMEERAAWMLAHPEPHTAAERSEYARLFPQRFQEWLDAGYGACQLARPEVAGIVENALKHFDGSRYRLGDFVIMPNHVHLLVSPLGEHLLSDILQMWKSFTAKEINRQIEATGHFWQKESFDHIVRSAEQLERIRAYIRDNPRPVEAASRRLELEEKTRDASSTPRRFIMIEMEEKIAREVTAERVRRVAEGYKNAKGEQIPGLGGGFRFCELGEELFDGRGQIRESVKFADLARHVYFVETGEPLPRSRVPNTPLLGVHNGRAICLLYNGILKDKSPQGGNALTHETLAHIKEACGECSRIVVFGTSQRIAAARLKREGVTFKQIPYTLK